MTTMCAEYRRWLSPYVDAMLEPDRRAELDTHLRDCGSCRQELASLQGMLQTLRTLEPPETPDLVSGVRRKLDAAPWWRRLALRFSAPWPVSLPLHGLALATTALLVVVAANLPGVSRRDKLAQKRSLVIAKQVSADAPRKAAVGGKWLEEKSKDEESRLEGDRLAVPASVARKRVEAPASLNYPVGREEPARMKVSHEHQKETGQMAAGFSGADEEFFVRNGSAESTDAALREAQIAAEPAAAPPDLVNQNVRIGDKGSSAQAPQADDEKTDMAAKRELKSVTDSSTAMPALPPSPSGGPSTRPPTLAEDVSLGRMSPPTRQEVVLGGLIELKGDTDEASGLPEGLHALEPLQVQWRVADIAAAASQVSEWVAARQGWVVATNEHHLSIKLPASAVPEFLAKFSTDPPPAPSADQPIWMTISLELVRTE